MIDPFIVATLGYVIGMFSGVTFTLLVIGDIKHELDEEKND